MQAYTAVVEALIKGSMMQVWQASARLIATV